MRTLVFQHTEEESPGTLAQWLNEVKFPFHVHHLYRERLMPVSDDYDWLIVLGGPMNLDELEKHPWLKDEKKFIGEWLKAKKPILGICLGGQLLAQTLGATVSKNSVREIGFHSVSRTAEEHPAFRRWPMMLPVFQWHEDRFSLPKGCQPLLTSEACEHQAFALDRKTVGFQFHPESTERWILGNYEGFTYDPSEKFVQDKAKCVRLIPGLLPPMTKHFFEFLEDFVENCRS